MREYLSPADVTPDTVNLSVSVSDAAGSDQATLRVSRFILASESLFILFVLILITYSHLREKKEAPCIDT